MSHVTGSTYGAFNDIESVNGHIKMCEVFPSAIEGKFEELIRHLDQLTEIVNSITPYEKKKYNFQDFNKPEHYSQDQLDKLAGEIDIQTKTYHKEITTMHHKHDYYLEKKKKILEELDKICEILNQLKQYKNYDSKCTAINKSAITYELNKKLNECGILTLTFRYAVIHLLNEFPSKNGKHIKGFAAKSAVPSSQDFNIDQAVDDYFDEFLTNLKTDEEQVNTELTKLEQLKTEVEKVSKQKQAEAEKQKAEEELKKQQAEEKAKAEQQKADQEKNNDSTNSNKDQSEKKQQPKKESQPVKDKEPAPEKPKDSPAPPKEKEPSAEPQPEPPEQTEKQQPLEKSKTEPSKQSDHQTKEPDPAASSDSTT
ncbi:hypothetical protein MUN89_00645 [Halobacillus salinarum]|uniref:Uncharacterized protein n=1 Tax=Halobacillus salinarum TaxID=2932257 RepID=A0ABY4ELR5_9BACI|nr:hypothetical protein [Halobacillus salinarum]UOQ44537.1 hypothetical protein MUN89_00645 [Halobacillus salinarum]